jgi:hypothetical protein
VDGSGGWIATYTGRTIYPLNPDPVDICIEDVAHSLANQCRFTGHVRKFYSTAQHSVAVSHLVPEELALTGLLHDAGEAYMSDIARPVKHADAMSFYRVIEDLLEEAIAERFGLPWPFPPEIKEADKIMLWTEMRDLMPNDPPEGVDMLKSTVSPWLPPKAERVFLLRYQELTGKTPTTLKDMDVGHIGPLRKQLAGQRRKD